MKKTKLTRSLLAACSIVALSVVLSGCLHSGGDDDEMDTGGTMPMVDGNLTLAGVSGGVAVMPGTYSVDAALEAAFADAPEGLAGVDHAMGAMVSVGGVNLTCATGPCRVDINDDGTVTVTGTIHTADYTPPDPGPTDEEIAAATAAAATKAAAIAAEAAQGAADNPDAGLGGSARTDSTSSSADLTDDVYGFTVSRDRDGTTIEITDPANAGDDDPKFAQTEDLGGGITMHTRTMAADDDGNVMEEVVMVRTTIEAPTATAFAMVAGQALNVDLDTAVDADNDGTVDDDLTALAVGADINSAPDEMVRGLVMSDAFTAGSGASVVHTFARYQLDSDGTTPGNQSIQAYTTPGTYNGAMGTYRCGTNQSTADCTVTVDADGDITAMSAGWAFIPDAGATSDVPDADYMSYGFWLKRTTDDMGVLTYNEVETYAMSSLAATGDVSAVTGSASYSGDALGVYVRNVYDTEGNIDTATSGHFTADVALTAYFAQTVDDATTPVNEGGQIPPSLLNSISGTISNFDLSGGEENEWAVNLMQAAITTNEGTASGMAQGGGADGSYNTTFYGPAAHDHDGDTNTVEVPIAPGSVIGEFNANFSNGTVAGGFGAEKD